MASKKSAPETRYQPGEIYSFKTKPATRFSPPDTGRYSVLKILGPTNFDGLCVAVLDGVFASPPSPAQVVGLKPLLSVSPHQPGSPRALGVDVTIDPGLEDFRLVSIAAVTADEEAICADNRSHGHWLSAAYGAEYEWRMRNDTDAYKAEAEREAEAEKLELQEQKRRRDTRLKVLTIAQLRSEPLLPTWDGNHPPADFTAAVRARILETMTELEKLGAKPGKAEVRMILKGLMNWLNTKDEERDHPIETIEREDLCVVIEELCWAAKQPSLVDPILDMRDW